MIYSVGIDVHKGRHRVYCLDERAQVCDAFSFQTTPEGLSTLGERIFRDSSNPVVADGGCLFAVPAPRMPSGES